MGIGLSNKHTMTSECPSDGDIATPATCNIRSFVLRHPYTRRFNTDHALPFSHTHHTMRHYTWAWHEVYDFM